MMDLFKDYWGIIISFLAGAVWVGKIQRDVTDLNKKTYVTNSTCTERRDSCGAKNALQFSSGDAQFKEIKTMIAEMNKASNERHSEIIKLLLHK